MTPDVNVLAVALRSDPPHHNVAGSWLESAASAAASGSTLVLTPMVLASYLRLVSDSKIFREPTPSTTRWHLSMHCSRLKTCILLRSALSGRVSGNFSIDRKLRGNAVQTPGLLQRRSILANIW